VVSEYHELNDEMSGDEDTGICQERESNEGKR
jgi:hypothetical protein